MDSKSARNRAVKLLNYRKQQFPPDIYYIRRDPVLYEKYLDPYNYMEL